MVEYRIDFETCKKTIRGVCSMCGNPLEPIETVDNSGNPTFWAGCKECWRFQNIGTDPEVYRIAKKLVFNHKSPFYGHIKNKEGDSPEVKQYNLMCQISMACGVVRDVLSFVEKDKDDCKNAYHVEVTGDNGKWFDFVIAGTREEAITKCKKYYSGSNKILKVKVLDSFNYHIH